MRRFAMVLSMAFLIAAQVASCATAAEQPFVVYEVKAGDTVRNVAARHGIDPLNLTAANGLAEADALPPAGTVLLIPKSAKDVLGTLYEAKRRGLGAWPKPRFADEFLAPLVPQNAGAGSKKRYRARRSASRFRSSCSRTKPLANTMPKWCRSSRARISRRSCRLACSSKAARKMAPKTTS